MLFRSGDLRKQIHRFPSIDDLRLGKDKLWCDLLVSVQYSLSKRIRRFETTNSHLKCTCSPRSGAVLENMAPMLATASAITIASIEFVTIAGRTCFDVYEELMERWRYTPATLSPIRSPFTRSAATISSTRRLVSRNV